MGIALFRLDKIEEAIDAFKGALALDAKNIESYNNLGIVYKSVGEVEKARETFERALAMSPRNGEVHYNLAQLYESEGAWESAFIHYQQFLESSDSKYEGLKEKVREHLLMLAKHPGLKETDEIDELRKE
jgi:tetratricopeptide (TPR) repeat protein